MDCPPGPEKVAGSERWPLVETRLYSRQQEHYICMIGNRDGR